MKHIVLSFLFLAILLLVSVFVFEPTYLYYQLPWLDIPMHVLGGLGVASLVVAIASYGKQRLTLTQIFILYLVVAISWELYELIKDIISSNTWNGWSDTLSDIANGAIGAYIGYLFTRKNKH